MLDDSLRQQLQSYLQRLTRPVQLVATLDGGARSQELRALLEEIVGLSDLLTLKIAAGSGLRAPSFAVAGPDEMPRLSFAGIPLGHEFTSLVLALLHTGGHPPKIDAATIERVKSLSQPLNFEIYVSLSCQNCPDVVQALNLMSVLNPLVSSTMIDGALFDDEVAAREILAVPAVFLNGQPFAQGRLSLDEILDRVDVAGAAQHAAAVTAEIANKEAFDLLVVGGGPAGAAAAIYAARKGIRTGVVAERFGGQLQDTLGIENFISVPHTEGPKLTAALESHVRSYGVDVMDGQRVRALRAAEHVEITLESGAVLRSRAVVVATGARWREMNLPGEREYRNRGVAYCPHCDGPLFKGKRVAVVGGGNSGVEAAIDLAGLAAEVTLIEYDSRLRADAVLQRRLQALPNVRVIVSAQTTEVVGDGNRVTGLRYEDRTTHAAQLLPLDGIFVQIGLLPNTDWLRGTLALSARGEIEVGARGETSLHGVYAAGDVTTSPYKQIVIAMGAGASAALGAFDYLIRTPAAANPAAQSVAA